MKKLIFLIILAMVNYSYAGLQAVENLEIEYDVNNQADFVVDSGGDLSLTASGGDISLGNENLTTIGSGRFDGGLGVNADPDTDVVLNLRNTSNAVTEVRIDNDNSGDSAVTFFLGGALQWVIGIDRDNSANLIIGEGAPGSSDNLIIGSSLFDFTNKNVSNIAALGCGTITVAANSDVLLSGTGHVTSGSEGFIVGTLTITDGSIDDTDGSIAFGSTNLTGVGTIGSGNITSTGTVQGEQLTSTDDITMAGVLTNTLAAANVQGLIIDGATNPFVYDGTTPMIFNEIKRTVTGSGSDATFVISGTQPTLTWDYDFDGIGGTQILYGMFPGLDHTGDIKLTGFLQTSTWHFFGSQPTVSATGDFEIDTATGNLRPNYYGTQALANIHPANVTETNGNITMNIYGGFFDATGNWAGTNVTGTPTTNWYGGFFRAQPTNLHADVIATTYGGYFTATGGDTNYGIYVAAGDSYLADKLIFTQTDGAEKIDSDADGTLDLYAGTSIDLHGAATITGNLQVNGGDIGITADTDLIQLASGALTVNGTLGVTGVATFSDNVIIDSDTASLQLGADQDIYLYSDTDAELSIKGDDNTKDIKLLFESGNEGSITWMEDELRFDFDGHIQIQKDSGTAPFIKINTTLSGAGDEVYLETNYDSGGTPIRTRLESKQGLGQVGTFTVHDLDIVTNSTNRMTVSAAGYVRIINRLRVGADSAPTDAVNIGNGTNEVAIDGTGDINFKGGAGLVFGSLWGNEIGFVTAADGVYVEITDDDINSGQLHNVTYNEAGEDTLDIGAYSGMYLVNWAMSVKGTGAGKHIVGAIGVDAGGGNNALTEVNDGRNHAVTLGASEMPLSGTAILDLSANSEVGLMVVNETDGTNVTVEHFALTVVQVGGT